MTVSARPPRSTTHPSGASGAYEHYAVGRPFNIRTKQTPHGPLFEVHDDEHTVCRSITKSHAERVCQRENERAQHWFEENEPPERDPWWAQPFEKGR